MDLPSSSLTLYWDLCLLLGSLYLFYFSVLKFPFFFFIDSISSTRFLTFPFVSRVLALTSIIVAIWIILSLVTVNHPSRVEIFLILHMPSNFGLSSGYFKYYVTLYLI